MNLDALSETSATVADRERPTDVTPTLVQGRSARKRQEGGAVAVENKESRLEGLFSTAVVALVGVMIFPLPPVLLDLLLGLSVSLSLLIFVLALNIERPLQLSTFPSILLILTLFRLSINVASTRLILLNGHEGADSVSRVIAAFGDFVVGGNTVVGIIVFAILVTINFVVITKGAGRIAEVSARFALDKMPGKQMAVDADLAAGVISEQEARARREAIDAESSFYGAMDGASKFVRGDAIAGILVTLINIVGGFVVGVAQQDMAMQDAFATYTRLTVGDGLVSQLPALLTSVAAGLLVTRGDGSKGLGGSVVAEVTRSAQALWIAAGLLLLLATVPGIPGILFAALAASIGVVAFKQRKGKVAAKDSAISKPGLQEETNDLEQALPIELLQIEVGYELVGLVDENKGGALLRRIAGVRKQIAEEYGIIVPPIRVRDNISLAPSHYQVLLNGSTIGRGEVVAGSLLAMAPNGAADIPGREVVEPVFGLPAKWIHVSDKQRAEMMKSTVVDTATVIATHLGELLASHAAELLGRSELQQLLDLHMPKQRALIEELLPTQWTHAETLKVLRALLRERVSVRDFRTILDVLAENSGDNKNIDATVEDVRRRFSRYLTSKYSDDKATLYALNLAPGIEDVFRRMQGTAAGGAVVTAAELQGIVEQFENGVREIPSVSGVPVVLAAADIRRAVAVFVARHMKGVPVLSFRELDPSAEIQTVGMIGR